MKRLYFFACCLIIAPVISAQIPRVAPAGGGGHEVPTGVCITPEKIAEINIVLAQNRAKLIAEGKLSDAPQKTSAVSFGWPLAQAPGFAYYNLYGVSNYVDHDLTYPNKVQDWNCGTRTYDLSSGYNHGGMDIYLWPFSQQMMAAKQAQIVAAAPGTILAKYDGNFDMNCALGSPDWNAVYITHSDGTVAWYGHMKSGSLITKGIGSTVVQGEYLGSVGSSGSSTGPHLHFEVHDASGTVLDPYHGNCSSTATMWQSQKPYYESAINAVLTHSAAPVFPACPTLETTNIKDTFLPGQNVVTVAYYHDQQSGQNSVHTILKPDNSVWMTWQHAMTQTWYSSSYWYWTNTLPADAVSGKWQYKVVFQGNTYTHDFLVKSGVGVSPVTNFSGTIYPNPSKDVLHISVSAGIKTMSICAVTGQSFTAKQYAPDALDVSSLGNGMYFLTIAYQDGHTERAKFCVLH